MRCPACPNRLEPRSHDTVTFHGCPRCAGLFFDAGVLRAVSDCERFSPPEGRASAASEGTVRPCPACPGRRMDILFIEGIEVDQCPDCYGVWLDGGEFQAVRGWYAGRPGPATAEGSNAMALATGAGEVAAQIAAEGAADLGLRVLLEFVGELLSGA